MANGFLSGVGRLCVEFFLEFGTDDRYTDVVRDMVKSRVAQCLVGTDTGTRVPGVKVLCTGMQLRGKIDE